MLAFEARKENPVNTSMRPPSPAQQAVADFNSALLQRLLLAFPIACLCLNAIAWLIHGVDVPFWDDWRPLIQGEAGDLSLKVLFTPANDTLYPVGLLLDSLSQRYLLGNSIVYQFLSLVLVLGSLLWLQWKLLGLFIEDRLVRASVFTTTLFMLQPNSYWGLQNMAFHQALPLVGVLFILDVIYRQHWKPLLSPLLIAAAATLSGLTYISGAFAMLAGGIALLGAAFICKDTRRSTVVGGLTLAVAGLITSIPQGWVIAVVQHGVHTNAPMALPHQSEFWAYLLGKVGRALMLPTRYPALSLTLTVATVLIALSCGALLVRNGWKKRSQPQTQPEAMQLRSFMGIMACVFAVVAIYLAMVAAGRTNLRDPAAVALLDIYKAGFPRFHFFWVTIAWPWLLAGLLLLLRPYLKTRKPVILLALLIVGYSICAGAFSHGKWYADATEQRVRGMECLGTRLEQRAPLTCETLYPGTDLAPALRNAERLGASFSRTLELAQGHELPKITTPSRQPVVLGGVGGLVQKFTNAPAIKSATSIAVFAGTYGGTSDGILVFRICQQDRCTEGEAGIAAASDNDFITARLAAPFEVVTSSPLTITLTTRAATRPIAIWGYEPPLNESVSTEELGSAGSVKELPETSFRFKLIEEL